MQALIPGNKYSDDIILIFALVYADVYNNPFLILIELCVKVVVCISFISENMSM